MGWLLGSRRISAGLPPAATMSSSHSSLISACAAASMRVSKRCSTSMPVISVISSSLHNRRILSHMSIPKVDKRIGQPP